MSNRAIKNQLECPYTDSSVERAFGEEVNMFLHCHLRGYDRKGEGKVPDNEYYDKYGAPLSLKNSWTEGYNVVEQLLAEHFMVCNNDILDFPLVAGAAGGVHLYKPLHNDKPYDWTGWIPLQKKWLCEGKFFSNRYFLAVRGNEIQNNLWDYHPFQEDEDVPEEERDDMVYSQVEPNDAYRGGYFFEGNPVARYLHVMSVKAHYNEPATGKPKRYNYIVHPLAYRRSLNNIPDNGVDAMQWSIINIAKEKNFGANEPWGNKCHALEIFNDFTFSASYAAENEAASESSYNGALIPGDKYRYWFDTYPLEYAEFLLDSALARGVYLHTLTNNDAFYKKMTVYDTEATADENEERMRSHMSDPKGGFQLKHLMDTKHVAHKPTRSKIEKNLAKLHEKKAQYSKIKEFLDARPYGFETVFGYTTLIDTERNLSNFIFRDRKMKGTGIDEAESFALDYLLEGNFFASLGINNLFDYSKKDQFIPYVIKGQPNQKRMCLSIDEKMAMEFTFEKCTKKDANKRLVWRYTIMSETPSKTLETVHGYFKLSTSSKTVLDLSASCDLKKMKWLYFNAIDPENPMKRAWFNAVQGPAFGTPKVDAFVLPDLEHKVFCTKSRGGKTIQGEQMKPFVCKSGDLDFMFKACSTEKDDVCVYFLQAYPLQQDITLKGKTDKSDSKRPPRILQSIHGLMLMHPEHATRLKLSNSWDKDTVKNGTVYFYEISADTCKPQDVCPIPEPRSRK